MPLHMKLISQLNEMYNRSNNNIRYCTIPISKIHDYQCYLDKNGCDYKFIGYSGNPVNEGNFEVRKYIYDDEDPDEVWKKGYEYVNPYMTNGFFKPLLYLYFLIVFLFALVLR